MSESEKNLRLTSPQDSVSHAIEWAEQEWLALVDAISDPIFLHDSQFRVVRANRAYEELAGMPFKELIGKPYWEVFPKRDGPLPGCAGSLSETVTGLDYEVPGESGQVFTPRAFVIRDVHGCYLYSLHILEDATARKEAERKLQASEARYRRLFETAKDGILILDKGSGRIVDVNPFLVDLLGYSKEVFLDKQIWDLDAMEDKSACRAAFAELQTKGYLRHEDLPLRARDGSLVEVEFVSSAYEVAGEPRIQCNIRDITDRRRTERAFQRSSRALRVLSACNGELIRAKTELPLMQAICTQIVEAGGYRMAWVGAAEDDTEKTVRPIAQYGYEEGYLAGVRITWADTERGRGPTGTAIRTASTQVNQNVATNPRMAPWREDALKRGYASSIAIPLTGEAGTFGALTIYAPEADAFDPEEMKLLEELANDLSFGIVALRTRMERDRALADRRRYLSQINENLEDAIQAIAATIEMRDPYTAGHERRVSELATAIAEEMHLTESQVDGLRIAASVHDLGKIRVPSEILSRPGLLTDIESNLVRVHPRVGYEILKRIDFPWPVATMVLQHHERLDGSGYPDGLRSGQILLEAQILAVADVVESMASHRPYRAALGLSSAMDHIEKNKGLLFNPEVVDACIRVLRERGFTFSQN